MAFRFIRLTFSILFIQTTETQSINGLQRGKDKKTDIKHDKKLKNVYTKYRKIDSYKMFPLSIRPKFVCLWWITVCPILFFIIKCTFVCIDSNYGFVCEWNAPCDSIIFIELTDMIFCKWFLAYRYIIHLLWSTAYLLQRKKNTILWMWDLIDSLFMFSTIFILSTTEVKAGLRQTNFVHAVKRDRIAPFFIENKSLLYEMIRDPKLNGRLQL